MTYSYTTDKQPTLKLRIKNTCLIKDKIVCTSYIIYQINASGVTFTLREMCNVMGDVICNRMECEEEIIY